MVEITKIVMRNSWRIRRNSGKIQKKYLGNGGKIPKMAEKF